MAQETFQQGEVVVQSGFGLLAASFVHGRKLLVRRTRPLLPLSDDEALSWAIRFEAGGFPKAAEDIFNRLCNGETIHR